MATVQNYTYPGVYLNETEAVTHQVTPATTNLTAFLGVFDRGPTDEAVYVSSWSEFEAQFGGLDNGTLAPYAAWQFFLNGGIGAWVVRLTTATTATADVAPGLALTAVDPGVAANNWSAQLTTTTAKAGAQTAGPTLDLTITNTQNSTKTTVGNWKALDASSAANLAIAINNVASQVVTATAASGAANPAAGDAVQFKGGSADEPATTPLGPLTISAQSPGKAMNNWTVALAPAGGVASPNTDYVSLTVTASPTVAGGAPVVKEVLSSLPTADADTLAQLIHANSNFVTADVSSSPAVVGPTAAPVTVTATAPGAIPGVVEFQSVTPLTGSSTVTVAVVATPPPAPAGTAASSGGTAPASASGGTAAAAAPATVDVTITGPDPAGAPETLTKLPTDPLQFALQVSSQSKYVKAVVASSLTGGQNATWTPTSFVNAVLTELGQDPDSGAAPPPVPRLDQIAPAVFNLMCIPDAAWLDAGDQTVMFAAAHNFCLARQAFLLVDPPPPSTAGNVPQLLNNGTSAAPSLTVDNVGTSFDDLQKLVGSAWGANFLGPNNIAAATYYPWIQIPDPANKYLPRMVPPSGTVAGVYARTDVSRGVWKAPAGVQATLESVPALADTTITDEINGELNVKGVNCLRTFPRYQNVVWGSRTLAGDDVLDSVFKYVPSRRLADYIEQSLQRSLVWAVFEPNGPDLWASIVAEIVPFMAGLYASGAFIGATARQAYLVVCDATTTTTDDMLRGVVNIQIGFQPVDPAEFVVLNVQVGALAAAAAS